ncbi:hypothetical protein PO124_20455 [Bacillus licheniformis]|nr:hypothetical protein [Bacillus licheniformis]
MPTRDLYIENTSERLKFGQAGVK